MHIMAKRQANVMQAVPFFRITDMDASIRFYVDGVGFAIANRWDVDGALRWCRLELGGAAIMLQTRGPARPRSTNALGEGVSVCFQCLDALAIYRTLSERGITATEPEVGNGMWYTCISDPDGYRLEFHSVTNVPEDTKLSEIA